MDRLLVVIALVAPHRELPGGTSIIGAPSLPVSMGWGCGRPCFGPGSVGRMSRLFRRLRGNRFGLTDWLGLAGPAHWRRLGMAQGQRQTDHHDGHHPSRPHARVTPDLPRREDTARHAGQP